MNSSEQQLLDDLKSNFPNFSCTLQDLKNPTEEFVTSFYTFWLSEFEVNIGNIPQIQFSQTQIAGVSAYPDSYSSIIPKVNLLKSIRAFNVVQDFGMLDIVSPTPKRTQSILKAFCDFFVWSDERIATMIGIKEAKKLNERKQKLSQMLQDTRDLREKLNNVLTSIGQIQESKKEMEDKIIQLQQRASELRMEKDILKTQSDQANEKIREKEVALQKLNKEDSQVTNKMKEYSNQVVDSPSGILVDLESLRLKCEEMAKLSDQKHDMVGNKMQTQDNLEKLLSGVQQRASQLDDVLGIIEHKRNLVQIVSEVEQKTADCQEELKELKSMLISQISKKNNRQEALQSLNLKLKTVKAQLMENVEAAKRELNDQKNAKGKMILLMKEDAEVEENIASLMEKIKADVEAFERAYNDIIQKEEHYFEQVQSEISSRVENIKKEVEKRYKQKKSSKKTRRNK